jgi:transcriptional regulator with XRE-family HTH domain
MEESDSQSEDMLSKSPDKSLDKSPYSLKKEDYLFKFQALQQHKRYTVPDNISDLSLEELEIKYKSVIEDIENKIKLEWINKLKLVAKALKIDYPEEFDDDYISDLSLEELEIKYNLAKFYKGENDKFSECFVQ